MITNSGCDNTSQAEYKLMNQAFCAWKLVQKCESIYALTLHNSCQFTFNNKFFAIIENKYNSDPNVSLAH